MNASTDPASAPELRRWLADTLGVAPRELQIDALRSRGDSNLMYELDAGGRQLVLRLPPTVKNDRSAHDVLREYRMLEALEQTDVPHPAPVLACDDERVAGRPFYVMGFVDGFSPSPPAPSPWSESEDVRRDLGLRAAEALADLSLVDYTAVGLDGFGRPDGFLARQVPRWLRQLESTSARELAGLREVGAWLDRHRPPDRPPSIVHGDYHLRNVMFAPNPPGHVVAIVDWEMSTIGDPMLDLGALLGTWSEPGEEVFMNASMTDWPGMATRTEIAAAYERRVGRPLEHLQYYMALALFKLACILEGSYARLLAGASEHTGHRTYETLVPAMVRRAQAIVAGELAL
jgi:aminoglycoside phosphotransferase (APT) family kinase protein